MTCVTKHADYVTSSVDNKHESLIFKVPPCPPKLASYIEET